MRKPIIFLFFILIAVASTTAHAQLTCYIGEWLAPDNTLLVIRDTVQGSNQNYWGKDHITSGKTYLKGNIISFQKPWYTKYPDTTRADTERYDFKVLQCSENKLLVKASQHNNFTNFLPGDTIYFTRRGYLADTSIHLQKLIYHAHATFGTRKYDLEINNRHEAKLHRSEIYESILYIDTILHTEELKMDTSANGWFTIQISDSLYNSLISSLQTCQLNTLDYEFWPVADASIITYIIYYNGKCKYLKSMNTPPIMYKLQDLLTDLCRSGDFQRTEEKFVIEE